MHLNLPTEPKTKKKLPAKYAMSQDDKEAFKELFDLALRNQIANYPKTPYPESFIHRYVPNTANGLTRCIIDWLKFDGQQAENIKVKGTMVDNTKVVTDVMGGKRIIGSVSYNKSSMTKGSADISSIIYGRAVRIEIKINTDKQSEHQKEYQQAIERAKGVYVIIKTISEWSEWYRKFKASLTVQKELF